MDNNPRSQVEAVRRLRELLVWSFIGIGVLLIVLSFLPLPTEVQAIARSLGLSLAPAGVVTLMLSRFASSITEMLLRETVEATIRDRLLSDMKRLDSIVANGMGEVDKTVKQGLDQIEHDMQGISPLFSAASKLGLDNVHLTRGLALTYFTWFLEAETQRAGRGESARVWVVATSIKGLLEATSEHFDGQRLMERIAGCGCDLRIMMTDPKVADFRGEQEHRAEGEIPNDIIMNIAYLKRIGVKKDSIRFYSGTPTVFAIATSDRMLLNPYPYQTQAFRCFSIVVHKTLNPDADIYHQYLRYHFEEPWQNTKEISSDVWNNL
jgi:hypothetical protein